MATSIADITGLLCSLMGCAHAASLAIVAITIALPLLLLLQLPPLLVYCSIVQCLFFSSPLAFDIVIVFRACCFLLHHW